MSLPHHPGDEAGRTAPSDPAPSKLMIILGIFAVAVLVGVVVALHVTGVLGPGETH